MPTLFQYAIFFLAALLCISLVLCVRESTDPAKTDKAPALPAGDQAARPALPPAAPLQRIEARGLPEGMRAGEPAVPRALFPLAADPALARTPPRARSPLPVDPAAPASPLRVLSSGSDSPALPASLQRSVVPPAGDPSRADPDTGAPRLQRTGPRAAEPLTEPPFLRIPGTAAGSAAPALPAAGVAPLLPSEPGQGAGAPLLLGTATPSAAALAPASPDPAPAVVQRIGPRPEAGGAPPRLALLSGGLQSEDIPAPARADRDMALDQRNDTLWDLVVHLRDYVEQLRAERHALREEARQLRTALAEATEEARVLRAAQGAANSNELTASPPEVRPTEAPRVGALPTRFH